MSTFGYGILRFVCYFNVSQLSCKRVGVCSGRAPAPTISMFIPSSPARV